MKGGKQRIGPDPEAVLVGRHKGLGEKGMGDGESLYIYEYKS